ncbi:MAG: EAL domain-containing protein [Motiliproteus sp.]
MIVKTCVLFVRRLIVVRSVFFAQPIVDLSRPQALPKYECLLRHYSDAEVKGPGEVLHTAAYNKILPDLDLHVIEQICSQFVRLFGEQGERLEDLSINISGASYASPKFNEGLVRLFDRYQIPRHKIILEVTEDIANEDTEYALATMQQLKQEGFKLALDDIGIGSSSFINLFSFPVDYFKIDRAYSESLRENPQIRRFVQIIIDEAKARGKQTIVEGIPDQETLTLVREMGGDYSQSFITGVPAELIAAPILDSSKRG